MGMDINGYIVVGDLTTANAGMCRWGFARRDGHEYFIKEYLSPKYPVDESKLGPALSKKMRENADAFFEKKTEFYKTLADCRTGNNMVALDFFRFGAKYYLVTDKVTGKAVDMEAVPKMSEDAKRTLIRAILHCIAKFHRVGVVHSDLKPENILLRETVPGYCTAKIIDFDAGFLETANPDHIEGSQNYFSPEAVQRTGGADIQITTKADVFALGLLFHQYWVGKMPEFPNTYHYASEAVLAGETLPLDPAIPEDVRAVIAKMLVRDPKERLATWEALAELAKADAPKAAAVAEVKPEPKPEPVAEAKPEIKAEPIAEEKKPAVTVPGFETALKLDPKPVSSASSGLRGTLVRSSGEKR